MKPKSLSPVGFTLPNAARRLEQITQEDRKTDAETIIAELWEKENIREGYNRFLVPLDGILHVCSDECGKRDHLSGFAVAHHAYSETHDEHDVRVIAATVQWMATNCGRCFYETFLRTLTARHKEKSKPKEQPQPETPTA